MSILDSLQDGDVIYCGPDRIDPGNYYLTYHPDIHDKWDGWADGSIQEFLQLLGVETKPHTMEDYANAGDLIMKHVHFHSGIREMHPKAKAILDAWKYKTNRKSIAILLQD